MKKIFVLALVAMLSLGAAVIGATEIDATSKAATTPVSFVESTQIIKNPDRGLYMLRECYVKDNAKPDISYGDFAKGLSEANYPSGTSLILLHFDLSYYSSNNGGTTKNITPNGLKYIENTIKNCTDEGFNVMLRFDYDMSGTSYNKDDIVFFEPEPPLGTVLSHIRQLSEIINKYKNYVYVLQSGMFGPWGEQHSSKLSKDPDAYYQMLDEWLKNTDSSIWVGVRYPYHFLDWYNKKYSKKYDSNTINQIKTTIGSPEYRVCMYDDGYLAASDDWGTYKNRTKEIEFFNSQTYAPFGGEACSGSSGLNQYNKISNLEIEAFKTHTSYLNYQWDYQKVIKNWEKNTYSGSDALYKAQKTSELNFVINRLGYRLVLRSLSVAGSATSGQTIPVSMTVENVGFGNISRKQVAYWVLTDKNDLVVEYVASDIDPQSFLSKTTKQITSSYKLGNVAAGDYKLYLKILPTYADFSDNSRAIRFANQSAFNEKVAANYIGEIRVSASDGASGSSSNSQAQSSNSQTQSNSSQSSQSAVNSKESATSDKGSYQQSEQDGASDENQNQAIVKKKGCKGCKASIKGQNILPFAVTAAVFIGAIALILIRNKKGNI